MFFLPTPKRMDSGDSNVSPGSCVVDYVGSDDEMPDGATKTSTAPSQTLPHSGSTQRPPGGHTLPAAPAPEAKCW